MAKAKEVRPAPATDVLTLLRQVTDGGVKELGK